VDLFVIHPPRESTIERRKGKKKKEKNQKSGHKKGRKRKKMTCLRRVFPRLVFILSRERKYPVSAPVLARIPNSHQNR